MIDSPNNGLTDFVICMKPNDKPIGKIGVWSGDEIGFLLDRSQWHKGFANEALTAIIPYLFDERKFESISADVDPRNDASTGILKKAGFEVERIQEKTLEIGGVWVDSAYLRLTKERWEEFGFQ
jgi:ribosomal-protein-alanine N-acetyltransferase